MRNQRAEKTNRFSGAPEQAILLCRFCYVDFVMSIFLCGCGTAEGVCSPWLALGFFGGFFFFGFFFLFFFLQLVGD